jgi:hypothetical protein
MLKYSSLSRIKLLASSNSILHSGNYFSKIMLFMKCVQHMPEPGRRQITIWYMRIACLTPKATNKHPEYITLIAFPLRQLLHDHTAVLRYSTSPALFSLTPEQTEALYYPGVSFKNFVGREI